MRVAVITHRLAAHRKHSLGGRGEEISCGDEGAELGTPGERRSRLEELAREEKKFVSGS